MSEKKEVAVPLTIKERFWKYASTKSEGTRIFNQLSKFFEHEVGLDDMVGLNLVGLIKIPGISRKAAKVVIDVVADFYD